MRSSELLFTGSVFKCSTNWYYRLSNSRPQVETPTLRVGSLMIVTLQSVQEMGEAQNQRRHFIFLVTLKYILGITL